MSTVPTNPTPPSAPDMPSGSDGAATHGNADGDASSTTHLSSALIRPLVIDLDGTLIRTDTTYEAVVLLMKHRPMTALKLPGWWARGRARVKYELGERVVFETETLPYIQPVLDAAQAQRERGGLVILATAATRAHAELISHEVGLFDHVLASDESTDLRGPAKRDAILELVQQETGQAGFDYIGDAPEDLPVWEAAGGARIVDPSEKLKTSIERRVPIKEIYRTPRRPWRSAVRALRPQQWVKNLLLYIPMLAAHRLVEPELTLNATLGFICFCLAASSIYLLNDLFDLDSDRHHPTKRHRPFAAGDLPLRTGLWMSAVLAPMALLLAVLTLPLLFVWALITYFAITTAYSIFLKRKPIIDVICLAGLYTLRILAGGLAVDIEPSPWLLAFSMFMFISLAFVKRFTELHALRARQDPNQSQEAVARGRGYEVSDLETVRVLGPMAGYLAVLVFCLYAFESDTAQAQYLYPQVLWLVAPVLLYWVSRVWLLAARGEVHEDPVVFAMTDPHAYAAAVVVVILAFIAAAPWDERQANRHEMYPAGEPPAVVQPLDPVNTTRSVTSP